MLGHLSTYVHAMRGDAGNVGLFKELFHDWDAYAPQISLVTKMIETAKNIKYDFILDFNQNVEKYNLICGPIFVFVHFSMEIIFTANELLESHDHTRRDESILQLHFIAFNQHLR